MKKNLHILVDKTVLNWKNILKGPVAYLNNYLTLLLQSYVFKHILYTHLPYSKFVILCIRSYRKMRKKKNGLESQVQKFSNEENMMTELNRV